MIWMLLGCMVLIGIGCSSVLMASVFIFARRYSPARLAVLTSSIVGVGTLGNVVGTAPLAAAAEMFGWREVIGATGIGHLHQLVVTRQPVRHGCRRLRLPRDTHR